jgi:hypothetical protein
MEPHFRVVIDHGLTTQILYRRARSAGDSFAEALRDLAPGGGPGYGRGGSGRLLSVKYPAGLGATDSEVT